LQGDTHFIIDTHFVFVGKTEALPIMEIMSLASDATRKQTELCERFTRGIEFFTASDWKKAAAEFKSILKDYPHDGPGRFYGSIASSGWRRPPCRKIPG
jgi:hypothetical protein